MKLRHRLENIAWWLVTDVAPTVLLCWVVAELAYAQGMIDTVTYLDTLELCP
ncbi:hypothetical protein [Marinobacter daepoensis]|uniref:hypothetical protein n=1 Tax=Marinobacter daepoensis TaxID=262077 RepID=UPI0004119F53|nr:hypothetical protein [Marinobacter daepoensis]